MLTTYTHTGARKRERESVCVRRSPSPDRSILFPDQQLTHAHTHDLFPPSLAFVCLFVCLLTAGEKKEGDPPSIYSEGRPTTTPRGSGPHHAVIGLGDTYPHTHTRNNALRPCCSCCRCCFRCLFFSRADTKCIKPSLSCGRSRGHIGLLLKLGQLLERMDGCSPVVD